MQVSKSQKRFRIIQKSSLSPATIQKSSPDKTTTQKFRLTCQSRKTSDFLRFVVSPKNLSSEQSSLYLKLNDTKQLTTSTTLITQQTNQLDSQQDDQLIVILHYNSQQTKFVFPKHFTTTQLKNSLISKINLTQKVLQFTTLDKNTLLDYYLTLDEKPMNHLVDKPLELQPYLQEALENQGQISLRQFIIMKCIGSGGFSKVYLVKWKLNGKFYAMKLIDKEFILKNRKEELVQNEHDIMSIINHPFTIQMMFAFEQKNYVVFILEFCSGGELFFQLKQVKRMSEDQARFYTTEICLAMLYLHQIGVMYRDIKPENILIDHMGHIRIADFGLSKITSPDEFAYSFCGSPEYMAPEMLLKQGHSLQVDHYCLGALLYELVTGLPPFYSKNTSKIYESILNENITFPQFLSSEIKDLLNGLLNKDPSKRLGSKDGVKEILQHKWFKHISISDVINKKLTPPLQPNLLRLNFDLKNLHQQDLEVREKLIGRSGFKKEFRIFKDFYFDFRENPHQLDQQLLFKEYIRYVDRIQIQKPKSLDRSDKKFDSIITPSLKEDKKHRLLKRMEDQQSLRSSPKPTVNQFINAGSSDKLKTENSLASFKRLVGN